MPPRLMYMHCSVQVYPIKPYTGDLYIDRVTVISALHSCVLFQIANLVTSLSPGLFHKMKLGD